VNNKTEKIKHLRALTVLLGKLSICSDRFVAEYPLSLQGMHDWPRYRYGMGLKDAKDSVEAYLDRKENEHNKARR
jgi:hypothetical protein